MPSFSIVVERDMAGLLKNCRTTTPRGVIANLKIWPRYNSCLMNKITGSQGQLPHQQMDSHFLRIAQKVTMVKTMTIGRKIQLDMNMARRDISDPTAQVQRARNMIMNKVPTRTRIRRVKNKSKKVKAE